MSGGVYKRPKLNIFGFSFCPQGPRLAAPQGTSTRGAGDLDSQRQLKMQFSTKNEGNFFFEKMPNWGGGVRGGFGKKQIFFRVFFLAPFPNYILYIQSKHKYMYIDMYL